ncbi:MAG: HD domain-containing protein [Candidatus Aminicenantes bacterium]|nr:HD domain-containing protein [Candidatus Aminicenantes bacterium]NIO80591.1 HD domain-containing protein [Candidatus Aminicenantes bacterium]
MGEEFAKVVRDPIYGYIGLTDKQLKVITLPVYQRLRRVSQLSFAELVYPNATHTRFSHSLGVMELARRVGKYIRTVYPEIEDIYVEALEWAGLLHDIGHFPFSHVFEPAAAEFIEGKGKTWKDFHGRWGQRILKDERFGIKGEIPDEILGLVIKLIDKDEACGYKILDDTVSGYFSIDRLDYLRRDAYHAGTPEYAIIDTDRLINSALRYEDTTISVYKDKCCYVLEGAILSYFYMYRAIYYHKTVRAGYLLFEDVLRDAFENSDLFKNKEWLEPSFWHNFDDYRCLALLRGEEAVAEKLSLLLSRKLPKVIKETELDPPNVVSVCKICQEPTYDNKIKSERALIEKLKGSWPDLLIVYLDSPFLVPYPPTPFGVFDYSFLWSGKNNEDLVPFAKKAPHLGHLAEASEQARVYANPVWKTDEEKAKFINDLKVAMKELRG